MGVHMKRSFWSNCLVIVLALGLALCVLYVPMSPAVTGLLRARRAARLGTASVIAGLVVTSLPT